MQQMTLAEVHVKWSVILMDLLGPDIFSTFCMKGQVLHRERAQFESYRLVIGLKWTSDQKVAYVFIVFEWNKWRLRKYQSLNQNIVNNTVNALIANQELPATTKSLTITTHGTSCIYFSAKIQT